MSDEAAFVGAVLAADAADDLPRLIYADWLNDHAGEVGWGWCRGEGRELDPYGFDRGRCRLCRGTGRVSDGRAERAEFIRAQIELANCPPCRCEGKVVNPGSPMRACRDVFPEPHEGRGGGPHCGPCRQFVRLRSRGEKLLRNYDLGWAGEPLASAGFQANSTWVPAFEWTWHRGFVEWIAGAAADWIRHADALTAAWPVRRVAFASWPDIVVVNMASGSKMTFVLQGAEWRPGVRVSADLWPPRVAGDDATPAFADPAAPMAELLTTRILAAAWPGIAFTLPARRGAV